MKRWMEKYVDLMQHFADGTIAAEEFAVAFIEAFKGEAAEV